MVINLTLIQVLILLESDVELLTAKSNFDNLDEQSTNSYGVEQNSF